MFRYKKPTDFKRKKLHLLTKKPLYLHLHQTLHKDWSLAEYHVGHQNSVNSLTWNWVSEEPRNPPKKVFFFFLVHHLQSQQYNIYCLIDSPTGQNKPQKGLDTYNRDFVVGLWSSSLHVLLKKKEMSSHLRNHFHLSSLPCALLWRTRGCVVFARINISGTCFEGSKEEPWHFWQIHNAISHSRA